MKATSYAVRHILAGALLLAAAGVAAQQPQVAPRGTTAQPRIPYGNEMGFFRPQSDPALTRIVPPREPQPPSAEEIAQMPRPSLEERLRWSEATMDRAESEAALQRAQINQYAPKGGFPGMAQPAQPAAPVVPGT